LHVRAFHHNANHS
jgi:adenosine kinase